MSLFITAPNGEIIEIGSGVVQGIDSEFYFYNLPRLSTNTHTLLRHWDGYSTEKLGTIPKIITLSRAEEKLLRQINPWKFFKMAMRSDYLKMIAKINSHRLSLYASIRMINYWKDPNSVYNSVQRSQRLSVSMRAYRANNPEVSKFYSDLFKNLWADPVGVYNDQMRFIKQSEVTKRQWANPESKINTPEVRKKMSNSAKARWTRLTDHEKEKAKQKNSNGLRRFHAWKRLSSVFDMFFIEG